MSSKLLSQATLADPRLTAEQEQPALPADRVLKPTGHRCKLAFPPNERGGPPTVATRSDRLRPAAHIKPPVLLDDCLMQLTQFAPRLDPELTDQHPPRVAIGIERLCLTAGPVQRKHPLPPQTLAQRMLGHQPLQLPG